MERKIVEEDIQKIKSLLETVLKTSDYVNIERLGGLTNHTYKVVFADGKEYIVRIPGEGTEDMISRSDEKISTELACRLEIDAHLLYFGNDGAKVSEYIENARTMSMETMREEKHIEQAAKILKKLHDCGENTGVPFDVFDMADSYEKILVKNEVVLYEDYEKVKEQVMKIKKDIDEEGNVQKVPCHNDPLCENWIEGDDGLYLVDWEYAGMNDAMWDLADLSIEADYSEKQDEFLLEKYFGHVLEYRDKKRFWANKIYLDYLWTLWGKTRVPYDGNVMEEYALERYNRLKENLKSYWNIIYSENY